MLKLRRLELSGFKSFVDPVTLDVHGGMTAIVGPNGCGKSNIADAVVWALGERSAKSLRGAKMEDVIFAGAKGRKPLGMAEVTLELISDINVTEILASPQERAIRTAEIFAQHFALGIGRDPRLLDVDVGKWEGEFWSTITEHPDFQDLLEGRATAFPDGEDLDQARLRAVSSVEEAMMDNPHGAFIVLVTPAAITQLILTHYLDMPASGYLRLKVCCGSLSVIRFISTMEHPQVLGVNLGSPLREILSEDCSPGT